MSENKIGKPSPGDMLDVLTDFRPISVADFQKRTGIDLKSTRGCEEVQWIVSPRDIQNVSNIIVMPDIYRDKLLASIGIVYNQNLKVYKDCKVHFRMTDSSSLVLGQKFVYRKNYNSIVENLRDLFKGFGVARGYTRLFAGLILGTLNGQQVLGHFLPPIIEIHGATLILMDGVHRSYLARQAGSSIECLMIEGVETSFPCKPHPWSDVKVVGKKPPKAEDRYWDLDSNLFRDLKFIGIDG